MNDTQKAILENNPKIKQWVESVKVNHVRNPLTNKSNDWQKTADEWCFILPTDNGVQYYTGVGHRVARNKHFKVNGESFEFYQSRFHNLTPSGFKYYLEVSKPNAPNPLDLLYGMITDSSVLDDTFEAWCANFGYSEDSIKARDIYFACQKNADILRKQKLGKIDELQEIFQDY